MRGLLKRGIELGLVRFGLAAFWRSLSCQDAVVLAYHNVVPAGDDPMGDSSLHLPLPAFNTQMDLLSQSHTIVPLKELFGSGHRAGKPLAAITFDDAYRGALELGVKALIRRGLPVTVFVAPGLLGCDGFWWDRVADPSSGAVPPGFRSRAFHHLGGRQGPILERAHSLGHCRGPLPDLYRPASEDDVDALARNPLVSLGSHTWSHVHLPSVPRVEAEEELRRSLTWLQARAAPLPFLLSYPYGAFQKGLEALVRKVGYGAGFLIKGGAMRLRDVHSGPLEIPRLNIPRGLSPEGFQARLSGAWPR